MPRPTVSESKLITSFVDLAWGPHALTEVSHIQNRSLAIEPPTAARGQASWKSVFFCHARVFSKPEKTPCWWFCKSATVCFEPSLEPKTSSCAKVGSLGDPTCCTAFATGVCTSPSSSRPAVRCDLLWDERLKICPECSSPLTDNILKAWTPTMLELTKGFRWGYDML